MRLHRSGAQIELILAILAITCEISWASKQCKTVVMDVHMKKCRLGVERAKRGLEKFDLQKYDEKYGTKKQEELDYSKMKDLASHGIPQKRQLSPGQIGVIAMPIVAETINGVAKARAYTTSGTGYYDPSPSLIGSTLGVPEYYLKTPYPFSKNFVPFRAPVSQSSLGSILLFGKRNLFNPSRSVLQSIKPLYSYGLKRFTII